MFKRSLTALLALFLVAAPANAITERWFGSLQPASSPAAAGTSTGTPVTGLDSYSVCVVSARLTGATGGTLDVYIQSSTANGAAGSWYDVAHYAQLAAGASTIAWSLSLQRGYGTGPTTGVQTPQSENTVDGTPTLAVATYLPWGLGNALRLVYVAGAGTSAGTTQQLQLSCTA